MLVSTLRLVSALHLGPFELERVSADCADFLEDNPKNALEIEALGSETPKSLLEPKTVDAALHCRLALSTKRADVKSLEASILFLSGVK